MKPLNDDLLTDYLFELLDREDKTKVEAQLKICPESRERLKALQRKFRQLELIPNEKTTSGLKVLFAAAAAIIAFSFFISRPLGSDRPNQSFASLNHSLETNAR